MLPKQSIPPQSAPSGELTLKQAGVMLLIAGIITGGVDVASAGHWEWGGIPVIYLAGLFVVGGVLLTVVGVVKKA